MKHYSTKDKEKAIFTLVVIVIMFVVLIWLALVPAGSAEPDFVYPMVNRNITWEGAGYNGIWGGAGK